MSVSLASVWFHLGQTVSKKHQTLRCVQEHSCQKSDCHSRRKVLQAGSLMSVEFSFENFLQIHWTQNVVASNGSGCTVYKLAPHKMRLHPALNIKTLRLGSLSQNAAHSIAQGKYHKPGNARFSLFGGLGRPKRAVLLMFSSLSQFDSPRLYASTFARKFSSMRISNSRLNLSLPALFHKLLQLPLFRFSSFPAFSAVIAPRLTSSALSNKKHFFQAWRNVWPTILVISSAVFCPVTVSVLLTRLGMLETARGNHDMKNLKRYAFCDVIFYRICHRPTGRHSPGWNKTSFSSLSEPAKNKLTLEQPCIWIVLFYFPRASHWTKQ